MTKKSISSRLSQRGSSSVLSGGYKKPMFGNEQTAHVARSASNAGMILFGGQPQFPYAEVETSQESDPLLELKRQDILSRIADLERQDAPEGYGSEEEIPQTIAGLPIKGVSQKGGRFVPSYGNSTPLFFGGEGLPPGFTTLPTGKIVEDPSYINPKQQAEMAADEQRKRQSVESLKESASGNIDTIQRIKKGKDFFGPFGNMPTLAAPSSLYGQYGARKDWEVNINKLLSQKIVDLMAEMKNVSKTGATGFGQLNQKELALLQDASTVLKRDLLPDQAMYYLDEMEKISKKIMSGGNGITQEAPVVDYKSKYGLE